MCNGSGKKTFNFGVDSDQGADLGTFYWFDFSLYSTLHYSTLTWTGLHLHQHYSVDSIMMWRCVSAWVSPASGWRKISPIGWMNETPFCPSAVISSVSAASPPVTESMLWTLQFHKSSTPHWLYYDILCLLYSYTSIYLSFTLPWRCNISSASESDQGGYYKVRQGQRTQTKTRQTDSNPEQTQKHTGIDLKNE